MVETAERNVTVTLDDLTSVVFYCSSIALSTAISSHVQIVYLVFVLLLTPCETFAGEKHCIENL